jgi:hypothetical protein
MLQPLGLCQVLVLIPVHERQMSGTFSVQFHAFHTDLQTTEINYYNHTMSLREIGFGDVDWIHLAQDRDRWRTVVNMVMNLWVP